MVHQFTHELCPQGGRITWPIELKNRKEMACSPNFTEQASDIAWVTLKSSPISPIF